MVGLMQKYFSEIQSPLGEELGISNKLAIPRLTKVVVSAGLGKAIQEKKRIEASVRDLTAIVGQRPVVCKARKSVSNFKLREGYDIGVKVTLRGRRMYEFVERFVNTAVPRMRDFRGMPATSFDGQGNYSVGIADQTIFPEIDIDKVDYVQGMNITFVTTARTDEQAKRLLLMLGLPLRGYEPGSEKQ